MSGVRRLWAVLAWAGTNVVLGVCAAFPLLGLLIVILHFRAVLFGTNDSPFQPSEVQGGEASGVITMVLIVVVPLLLVAVLANRKLIQRLELPARWTAAMALLTIAVFVTPAVILPTFL